MLQTRKSRVIFVTPTTSYEINLTKDQLLAGMEIEEHIVADVVCIWFYVDIFILTFQLFFYHPYDGFIGAKPRRFHGRGTIAMTCPSQKTVKS